MRIPDTMLEEWYRLVVESAVPVGRADGGEARARPLHRRPLARRRGGARAEAHFTRVVREGGAPEEVPEAPLPDGDPIHLPALLAAAFGLSTSDARRMIGQGGVKLNGSRRDGARRRRERSLAGALVQAGKRRFVRYAARLTSVDTAGPDPATIRQAAREGGSRNVLSLDTGAARERIGYDLYRIIRGPLARVRRSFCCPTRPASIFENSTACVKRRGLSSAFRRGRGVTPSVRFVDETVFPSMPYGSVVQPSGGCASTCG